MSYTLYDASILVAQDALDALNNILDAAAGNEKVSASVAGLKLADDMLPFSFQVFMVTDIANKLASRGTGGEPKEFGRELPDIASMKKRVAEAKEILAAVDKDTFNSRAETVVNIGLGPGKTIDVRVRDYVHGYVLPNTFFHTNMAYAILRKEGVDIGKMVYLSPFVGKFMS